MNGVEFIDDPAPDGHDDRPDGDSPARRWAAPGLWAVAAALAAVSGASEVYTYAYHGGVINVSGGWRANGSGLDSNLLSDHGPQFSIPIWACAVLFAAVAWAHAAARPRLVTRARLVGLGAAAGLAGTLVGMVLWMVASIDNTHAVAAAITGSGANVRIGLGPSPFLLGAAVLVATAGLVAPFVLAHRGRAVAGDEPVVPDITVTTRDDIGQLRPPVTPT